MSLLKFLQCFFARTILSLLKPSRTEALQKPLKGIVSNDAITEANPDTRRKYVLVKRSVRSLFAGETEQGFDNQKRKATQ